MAEPVDRREGFTGAESLWTVGAFHAETDRSVHADHWERHPHGHELLVVLSGALRVHLREQGREPVATLTAGQSFIVPPGPLAPAGRRRTRRPHHHHAPRRHRARTGRGMRRPILLACLAVFGLMAGQQMLNPILPPLAREFGFSELALGAVWAVGGAGVVLASPFWGRRTAHWGHRPVLLISLVGAMLGLLGFAFVAQAGLRGALAVPVLFAGVLLTRGIVFGLAWAATPVTAQSYIADMTSGPAERVRGMSMFGAAQGLALAVGPALGGVLSLTGNLLVPIYAAPVILAVIAVVHHAHAAEAAEAGNPARDGEGQPVRPAHVAVPDHRASACTWRSRSCS